MGHSASEIGLLETTAHAAVSARTFCPPTCFCPPTTVLVRKPRAIGFLLVTDEREQHQADEDGEWEESRWIYAPPDDELRATYSVIPVDRCIYCQAQDVACSFVFLQPPSLGLRLAVPGRIGLCEQCRALLQAHDFRAVLRRTRDTEFEYFPDDHILDLIRASRSALFRS